MTTSGEQVKAIDLKKGDEFMFQGELHHVTVNEVRDGDSRNIWTYAVERPRTAPIIIHMANNEEVAINGKS
jgi:hypothetical protein